ncbi:MAG: sugar ABC transporter substrate-binding protein, partial [Candidatus Atribacteria bacterium]|nr:sugar ABC transporter substrate-binding protein [Candidatus Atribacteria bacterium]
VILGILLVAVLITGIANAAIKKDPKDIEIPVIYLDVSINFAQPIKAGVEAAAKEFGVKAYLDGPVNWNIDQQISIIENYITKKVDGLAIAPLSSEVIDPIIAKALEAGIPVVTFNTDSPSSKRVAFYGQDTVESGRVQAKFLAEYLGGKGKVLITSCDAAAPWSQNREKGVREKMAEYPGIEIVGIINAKGDEQVTYAAIENAIVANPDLAGIASLDAVTTPAVGRAIIRYNLIGKVKQVGHDLMPETLDNIKAGATNASLSQNPYIQGYQPVKALFDYLTKDVPLESMDTGIVKVDKTNVDEYLKRLEKGDKTVG